MGWWKENGHGGLLQVDKYLFITSMLESPMIVSCDYCPVKKDTSSTYSPAQGWQPTKSSNFEASTTGEQEKP